MSPKGETIILKDEVACTIFDLFNLNETMTLSKIYEILRGKFSIPVEDGEFENDIVSFIQTLIGYQVIKGL
ncbi:MULTISPECIES: hypothetical protein [Paenibacillus]|uniref:PqqD family protein n=1 Tax=Paenibacillus pabuli TaxID=1472 RepID=A0A855XY52_9BACL|nr:MULTISPECIES: hypothetical protein [Paenibacillus]PWW42027.1 hypothetical protein DET56_10482 [Paenibacillus pabuli]PXW07415.1 hypothetical protein DEU73_10581 [Paenibacillus taichungensis]